VRISSPVADERRVSDKGGGRHRPVGGDLARTRGARRNRACDAAPVRSVRTRPEARDESPARDGARAVTRARAPRPRSRHRLVRPVENLDEGSVRNPICADARRAASATWNRPRRGARREVRLAKPQFAAFRGGKRPTSRRRGAVPDPLDPPFLVPLAVTRPKKQHGSPLAISAEPVVAHLGGLRGGGAAHGGGAEGDEAGGSDAGHDSRLELRGVLR